MRSILEKAIVHLLNEEQDKAEALFHKFMVEKARRIHESLRSGETVLTEGWDDEITSEEYMTEDDLESVEDHDGEGEGHEEGHEGGEDEGDDMGTDEAADELGDDLDADPEAEAEEDMGDAEEDMGDAEEDMAHEEEGEEGEVSERLADMEDQLEKLTAEFDKMMSEIEGDEGMGDEEDMGDEHMDGEDMGDEHMDAEDMGDEHMDDMGDDMGEEDHEEDHDMADRMEDDMTDEDGMGDDMGEHEDEMAEGMGMTEGKKGKIPPQFLKNMKKKKSMKEEKKDFKKDEKWTEKKKPMMKKKPMKEDEDMGGEGEGDMGEDDDLDDITESVMAELEKISYSVEDGKEVGAGKKFTPNDKSPMVQASVDKRGGAQPVVRKGADHTSFEREPSPSVKDMKARKNTVRGKADSVLTRVPPGGDKSAALNKDYAGSKNNKSAID